MKAFYECDELWDDDRCVIITDWRWFLRASYYHDYDVMFSLNVGLWWKQVLILEPKSYDHGKERIILLKPMI